jgi:hypothetical protein
LQDTTKINIHTTNSIINIASITKYIYIYIYIYLNVLDL